MKKLLLLCLGTSLLLAAGCATAPRAHRPASPPTAGHSPAAHLLVISAVYGSGTRFADVTYRVNDLLRQPGVEFFARPEWLEADPTPGWNKALVIVYEVCGERRCFTSGEGGKVSAELLLAHPQH